MRSLFANSALLATLILVALGCASPNPDPRTSQFDFIYGGNLEVEIDALLDPARQPAGKRYVLIPGMRDLKADDLEFRQICRFMDHALAMNGFQKAEGNERPELYIRLAYGIGTPQTETVTTGAGYSYAVGWMWFNVPPKTANITSFQRNLVAEAYDSEDPAVAKQVWKTTVTSVGTTNDLRRVLPYMITEARPYFGAQTTSKYRRSISGTDRRVLDIVAGPLPAQAVK
ncbi:MAG TPA: DUF4136 domain-containing protein [Geothrix sp.]|nr:DUF4136 domain-containing protein [Geothrix sp.]